MPEKLGVISRARVFLTNLIPDIPAYSGEPDASVQMADQLYELRRSGIIRTSNQVQSFLDETRSKGANPNAIFIRYKCRQLGIAEGEIKLP